MLKKPLGRTRQGDLWWKNSIGGYFLLLDYTDSEQLKDALQNKVPWFLCKTQDNFMVFSDLIAPEKIDDPHNVELELKVNGQIRQKDNTGNMHFKIGDQLDYINKYLTLGAGDLLLSGTPEGMGPVSEGDKIEGTLTYKGEVLAKIIDTVQRDKE